MSYIMVVLVLATLSFGWTHMRRRSQHPALIANALAAVSASTACAWYDFSAWSNSLGLSDCRVSVFREILCGGVTFVFAERMFLSGLFGALLYPAGLTEYAQPHLLVIGESGSGKTYAVQCICAELDRSGFVEMARGQGL
jgi:hypothetical protein